MKYVAGIDIGGTNTRVALINEKYELIKRIQFNTDIDSPANTFNKIKESIDNFEVPIEAVGISCPGPLDLINGELLETTNLNEAWFHLPVVKQLSALLKVPVYLENDANLAALAEAVVGEGKDERIVQFLTVSTGLESGLVIDKNIYIGAHGFAHEVANCVLAHEGPSHGSIYPGGVEALASGTAIVERARKAGLDVKHAGEVNDLSKSGNVIAQEIMNEAKIYLANFIAILQATVDPNIVILGGSVALKIDEFVEEVEALVKERVFDVVKPYVKVRRSTLSEDSGLIGAACLAFLKSK